jgi:hypothetical protein
MILDHLLCELLDLLVLCAALGKLGDDDFFVIAQEQAGCNSLIELTGLGILRLSRGRFARLPRLLGECCRGADSHKGTRR